MAARRKKRSTKRASRGMSAFMKPMSPSKILAAIIGPKALPRTLVTKKIWQYIKKHRLQDRTKRIMINADAKMKALFGGKRQVTMFELTKYVSRHLK